MTERSTFCGGGGLGDLVQKESPKWILLYFLTH